jgi:hypothetical protein
LKCCSQQQRARLQQQHLQHACNMPQPLLLLLLLVHQLLLLAVWRS